MLPEGLADYFARQFASAVVSVEPLAPDAGGKSTAKVEGYGEPLAVTLRRKDGSTWRCVFHTARANEFGHDRRSDRALQQLLAFDTFGFVPRHVAALDVGALTAQGPRSLADAGELYLLTEWAEGTPYAADLRRLAHGEPFAPLDLERAHVLAQYLAELHTRLEPDPVRYRRALRDTIGSGEGMFGITDAYGDEVTPSRLMAIEQHAVAWRWRLKKRAHRLSRTHGDFHPFNIVFRGDDDFSTLDASRGSAGEPADDVTALAVNYVFFALDHPDRWAHVFGPLWRAFWGTYLDRTGDRELLACVGPFLAWRALVVACPRFYPQLSAAGREKLLQLAELSLGATRFDPDCAGELFR